MTERVHFVYWMFDAAGQCLYVGCTKKPERRWKYHSWNLPDMIAAVTSRRMAGPYTRDVAYRIEREQQDALQPRFDGWINPKRPKRQLALVDDNHYEWLNVSEAASKTGVKVRTLQAAILRGDLPAHKTGQHTSPYIIHQTELDAWIARRAS